MKLGKRTWYENSIRTVCFVSDPRITSTFSLLSFRLSFPSVRSAPVLHVLVVNRRFSSQRPCKPPHLCAFHTLKAHQKSEWDNALSFAVGYVFNRGQRKIIYDLDENALLIISTVLWIKISVKMGNNVLITFKIDSVGGAQWNHPFPNFWNCTIVFVFVFCLFLSFLVTKWYTQSLWQRYRLCWMYFYPL